MDTLATSAAAYSSVHCRPLGAMPPVLVSESANVAAPFELAAAELSAIEDCCPNAALDRPIGDTRITSTNTLHKEH